MPGAVTDSRAHALRARYHRHFNAVELPVAVEAIAADLLGLYVEQADIDCSGLLIPSERRVVLNAGEPPARRRFTLAHELGHWICQVLQGHAAPIYCRDADLAPDADRTIERQANVFAAELLMPEPIVRAAWSGSVDGCAAALGVSKVAMHWRLYNLRLVSESPTEETSAGS
jgi:Zn-dependent peptidase ImmA (M78 family)